MTTQTKEQRLELFRNCKYSGKCFKYKTMSLDWPTKAEQCMQNNLSYCSLQHAKQCQAMPSNVMICRRSRHQLNHPLCTILQIRKQDRVKLYKHHPNTHSHYQIYCPSRLKKIIKCEKWFILCMDGSIAEVVFPATEDIKEVDKSILGSVSLPILVMQSKSFFFHPKEGHFWMA